MARGSIIKRGKRFYIVYRRHGKQIWRVGGDTKREAEARLRVELAKNTTLDNVGFADFADEWLESAKLRVKPSSFERYQGIVDNHLKPTLGNRRLDKITFRQLETLIDSKLKAGLKPATTNKIIVVVKIIFKRAKMYKIILDNPAEYLKQLSVEPTEKDFLRPDDLAIFLDHVKRNKPGWYAFFMIASFTGARISELLALRWSDINWKTNEIRFGSSLFRGQVLSNKTKTIGLVEIPSAVLVALKAHNRIINPLDLIFCHANSKPYDRSGVSKHVFKKLLRQAGLRDVTFHSLRHSYNSMLISSGANIRVVQDQLRHKTFKMTIDTYGHSLKSDKTRAVEEVANLLLPSRLANT